MNLKEIWDAWAEDLYKEIFGIEDTKPKKESKQKRCLMYIGKAKGFKPDNFLVKTEK